MIRMRWSLILWAGVLILGATAVSLTTYTQPIFAADRNGPVEQLLRQALGDSTRLPAGWSSTATGIALSAVPSAPESLAPAPVSPAAAWARSAVAADSGAVRAWLSPAVLEIGGVARDTVRLTLYRLTLHRGCPLLSRLDAVLAGNTRSLEVARVETTCPPLPFPRPGGT